jgi:hypothetical protein
MSIQVQCPNPNCGKLHKAKDKYAGLRCYCPACRAVMAVPARPAAAPRAETRRAAAPNGLAHAATLAAAEAAADDALVSLGDDPPAAKKGAEADAVSLNVAVEQDALVADDEAVYMQSSTHLAPDERLVAAELEHELAAAAKKRSRPAEDDEDDEDEDDEDRPAPPPARAKFKWLAAVALALVALSLLAGLAVFLILRFGGK